MSSSRCVGSKPSSSRSGRRTRYAEPSSAVVRFNRAAPVIVKRWCTAASKAAYDAAGRASSSGIIRPATAAIVGSPSGAASHRRQSGAGRASASKTATASASAAAASPACNAAPLPTAGPSRRTTVAQGRVAANSASNFGVASPLASSINASRKRSRGYSTASQAASVAGKAPASLRHGTSAASRGGGSAGGGAARSRPNSAASVSATRRSETKIRCTSTAALTASAARRQAWSPASSTAAKANPATASAVRRIGGYSLAASGMGFGFSCGPTSPAETMTRNASSIVRSVGIVSSRGTTMK